MSIKGGYQLNIQDNAANRSRGIAMAGTCQGWWFLLAWTSTALWFKRTPDVDEELTALIGTDGPSPRAVPPIWADVMRFLTNPHKPMILALSRPDPKVAAINIF